MSVSEAVFQDEHEFAKDTTELGAKLFGSKFHSFSLRTLIWQRKNAGAVDLFLEMIDGDRVYVIDSVLATTSKSYVFPNARTPNKVDMVRSQKYRFRTSGSLAGEDQSTDTVWAELGAP